MLVNKLKLQQALEIVKPGLASKEQIEQATSFAFIEGRVVTYNDSISLSHPVKGLELEGAVKADRLFQLLGKINTEEIELIIGSSRAQRENDDDEGVELIIKAGRSKAGLSLIQTIKLPLEEELQKVKKWHQLPESFTGMLKFTMTAAGHDMSEPRLTGVHVAKKGYIEASDGFRIVKSELGSAMPIEDFLIPASACIQVVRMNPTKIALGVGWMNFKNEEGTILSCRIFEEAYPETAGFYKMGKTIKITLPKTIKQILDKASIFAKKDQMMDEEIFITLSDKRMIIRGESEEGWFEESVNFAHSGDPVMFVITPYLLKDILSQTLEGKLSDDKISFSGDGWIYLALLRSLSLK